MEIIIYGKEGCINCDKTRMLCQIQSLSFQYLLVGTDITAEALQEQVGQPVRSLPQIFVRTEDNTTYVGGYDDLRTQLRQLTLTTA
ncbi:MAG: glutaredoxin domain-containing protein [Comamonas sp.]|jgi:glutaredoxin 1|nr:glutaredoxin domain-containing protein [Comamonas sp.]